MGRATNLLILASIGASIYSWYFNADLTFSAKALYAENYLSLITAIFAHADITHLLGNMLFLYVFGDFVEKNLGKWNLLFAFFFGGIMSFLLSIPFYPGAKMLGASAAIFTLSALAMLSRPLGFSIIFFMPVGVAALLFFIFNIFAITEGTVSNTGYISHVIGFLVGVAVGSRWIGDWKKNIGITIVALILYVILLNVIVWYVVPMIEGFNLF